MKRLTAIFLLTAGAAMAAGLPDSVVFVGRDRFQRLVARGAAENWAALPIGERVATVGRALVGTPYLNYTLELDPRIETPCVNMKGMDCWTLFEIALGTARALKQSPDPQPRDLLRMIELDRYRGGRCDGKFTSRLHHLEDWLQDNQRRGLVKDITPALPGARKLCREMDYMGGKASRLFRQLRADPSMVPVMARIERWLSERGITYVPKSFVPAAEKFLRDGDIICIVTTWHGDYTSHVGLAVRDAKGTLRFLHASKNSRAVIVDRRLSDYLNRFSGDAGIMVGRPNDLP
ncbi:MAG: N-acetylmuramoyl-L-alanine amidase-like domain-containing protein [Verrucomicrobiae bacterium]